MCASWFIFALYSTQINILAKILLKKVSINLLAFIFQKWLSSLRDILCFSFECCAMQRKISPMEIIQVKFHDFFILFFCLFLFYFFMFLSQTPRLFLLSSSHRFTHEENLISSTGWTWSNKPVWKVKIQMTCEFVNLASVCLIFHSLQWVLFTFESLLYILMWITSSCNYE